MDGMTITEFILARVAEDEEVARFAYPPPWVQHDAFVYIGQADDVTEDDEPSFYINGGTYAGQRRTATHAARHDPARVLAECETKRRIVELHDGSHECSTYDHTGDVDNCTWCLNTEDCSTMRLLAAVYANHPDYREEWR